MDVHSCGPEFSFETGDERWWAHGPTLWRLVGKGEHGLHG